MSASSDTYSTYKRLRPLIPKPAAPGSLVDLHQPTYSSIAAAADLLGDQLNPDRNAKMDRQNISYDFKHIQNHSKLLRAAGIGNCGASSQTVTSRWNPTADQLRILEDLYKRGIRTPSAEQIQYITAQLRCYGKIEGKNVFYWFQNHKARERQKRRRRLMEMSAAGLLPLRIDIPQPWEKFSKQQYSGANVARWSETNMKMKMTRLPPRPRNTFTNEEPAHADDFLRLATPSPHEHEECTTVQVNYVRSISEHKRCNSGRRGVCNPNPIDQHEHSNRENYVIEKAYNIGEQKSQSMQWPLGTVAKDEVADSPETNNTVLIDEEQGELRFLHRHQAWPEPRTSKPNEPITLELFPLYSESTTDYNSTQCDNTLSMSSEAEGGYNLLFSLKSKCDGMKIGEDRSDQEEERFTHYSAYFHEFLPLHNNTIA